MKQNPPPSIAETYERIRKEFPGYIQLQYSNSASISAMKALCFGDGIFDLDPYTDRNIEDVGTALAIAESTVNEYANAIITGSLKTQTHGLKAGQLLPIEDSTRGINTNYLIQVVTAKQVNSAYNDVFDYKVKFGTTLFGYIEFFQKLLASQDKIELNTDEIIETYVSSDETVESSEANSVSTSGGDERVEGDETVESSDVNQAVDFPAGTWRWEPNGVGQTLDTRWSLFDWG